MKRLVDVKVLQLSVLVIQHLLARLAGLSTRIGLIHDFWRHRITMQHLGMDFRIDWTLGRALANVLRREMNNIAVRLVPGGSGLRQARQSDKGNGERELYSFGGHFEVLAMKSEAGFPACAKSTSEL